MKRRHYASEGIDWLDELRTPAALVFGVLLRSKWLTLIAPAFFLFHCFSRSRFMSQMTNCNNGAGCFRSREDEEAHVYLTLSA